MNHFSVANLVSVGGILASIATLVLSLRTFRWTQRQPLMETIDLVPHWKWHDDNNEIGAIATLGCHNRSSRSIYVTSIEFFTKGLFFYSKKSKGVYYNSPVENPPPCQIKPDEIFAFRIDVSSAVRSIDFSKRNFPWLYRVDRHSLWVCVSTASGFFKAIRAREFIPADALEHYIRLGKTHVRI